MSRCAMLAVLFSAPGPAVAALGTIGFGESGDFALDARLGRPDFGEAPHDFTLDTIYPTFGFGKFFFILRIQFRY